MTPTEARAWVEQRLQRPTAAATRLHGGLLNHVHRVVLSDGRSMVVKRAPPHIASSPHIPLSPERADREASALRQLQGQPVPLLLDVHDHTLILEDIGEGLDLAEWLTSGGDASVLDTLAHWLQELHDRSGPGFVNHDIQQARLSIQYRPVQGWLADRGHPRAALAGQIAVSTGERFAEEGPDFVMGDLWPPSVQLRPHRPPGFVVLDWEMATAGHRAQDIGHLCAHIALEQLTSGKTEDWVDRFVTAYGPMSEETACLAARHQGCELLARTIGGFPRADLTPHIDHIVAQAVQLLVDAARPWAI